jgi:amino acid adenylation domain-containing protein/non-ribosomal peptide synthase protein (TIGR01720 family)
MKREFFDRKQILVNWNDTAAPYPKDKTIYQLFEDQVDKTPNNIAVIFEDKKLSYKDLNKKSNQLARLIRDKYKKQNKKDLKPDSLICLCVERSLDIIIGILGILKAGAGYVPLDPDYPQDRLEYMINDSHEGLIITHEDIVAKDGFLDKLHHDELLVIDSDDVKAEIQKQSDSNLDKISGPDNLAYVIYTSGSTGRPKGVMIEHRNLVNHMTWMVREFKFDSSDVIFQKTPYSFDASVWELFLPFIIGAKGIVSRSSGHKDPQYLVDEIISEKITVVQFVPSLLDLIMNDYSTHIGSSKLKRIFCGGEALKLTTNISKLDLQKIKLCNLYGPTESTIDSSFNDNISLSNSDISSISIGRPIDNIQLYILNKNLNPCPIGNPGELYIGGAGLARGYLNQEELTKERFILNPFAKELGLSKTDRIYKTGDLARWLPDGNIEYLGRTDFQVKIRGFRIELGEIENILAKHKDISQVTVIDKEKEGQKYLVAYYVIAKAKKAPEIDNLRSYLSETLPDYMVPSAFVKLDEMPLTPNGKIDRKALPEPDMGLMLEEYFSPRNKLERSLCDLFQNILGLERVGIKDDFFRLGGNSILATHLLSKISRELGINYNISDFLDSKNIYNLVLCDSIEHAEIDDSKSYNLNELHYFENLILLHQLQTDNNLIYNENCLIEINKKITLKEFVNAAKYITSKYEILNSNYKQEGDNFIRTINYDSELQCERITLDKECDLQQKLLQLAQKPFDLQKDKLIRCYLINLPNKQYINIVAHHVIIDATSFANIILPDFYRKLEDSNYDHDYSKQEILEFIKLSKEISRRHDKGKDDKVEFWNKNLLDCEPISISNKSISSFDHIGSQLSFILDKEITRSLRDVSNILGVSLFSVLYSLFSLLMLKVSRNEKVAIRTNIDERIFAPQYNDIVGCFINNIFIISNASEGFSLSEYITQSSDDILNSIKNAIPFPDLVKLDRTLIQDLSEVHFNIETEEVNDLPYEQTQIHSHSGQVKQGLYFELDIKGDEIYCRVEYKTALYDSYLIESLVDGYKQLVSSAKSNLNKDIRSIPLLNSEKAKQILVDWNDKAAPYPKDKTIYQLFEEQVNKTPDNIAVIFEDEKLSYKYLNKKSNQLAHLIRAKYKSQNKKDLKPDSLIGLCVERSLDMIIGILGILKAGAAYVPLDPDYPQDRLEYMIEDSHEGLIVTQKDILAKDSFFDKLHHDELLVIDSDEVKTELSKQSDANLEKVSGPDNLAYVIYTSGSTGKPKGTMLEQTSVVDCMFWLQKEYGLTDKDRVLQKTPISFDVSVSEYLWSLLFGASLVIAKPDGHKDPNYLAQLIGKHKVTTTHFVPSLLKVLIDLANADKQIKNNLSSLNKIFCAGEALNIEIVRSCSKSLQVELFNIYGPTESAIFATHYKCQMDVLQKMNLVPIGKGVDNSQVYILDNNLNPCPIGAPGELYLGGAGLARGYLNQEELTKERFISNPFAKELGLSESDRIYKTGDLVRWLPDGNIEYLGRTDFQVKIRGFRIELGEIENILAKHKAISQVSVIDKEKEGQKYLVAYYVISKDKKAPEIDDLRDHLSEALPDYMVPAAFVKLDEMPLTPNGKINRRALPDPDMSLMGEEYIAPRNEIEQKLADIWCDLLGLDKVGINDDFFRVGGDSIKSIQVVSKMKKAVFETSVKNFFDNPTIEKMSSYLSKRQIKIEAQQIKSEQGVLTGKFDLLPIQNWFFDRVESGDFANYNHWNQSFLVKVDKLDFDKLCAIIPDLISHHDMLRTTFVNKRGVWKQKYNKKISIPEIKQIDVSKLKNKDELSKILTKWQSDFNIEKGPLWQMGYLHGYQDNSAKIFIGFHRLIMDDVSSKILIKDIQSLYKGNSLEEKTCSYRQWVDAINKYPKTHSKERAYWKYINKKQAEFAKNIKLSETRHQCKFSLSKRLTKKLLNIANKAYNTEVNDLLLCALAYALRDWSKSDVNYVTLEGHGREDARLGVDNVDTVGCFTSVYPLELEIQKDFDSSIRDIKESLRTVWNKGVGYGAFCHNFLDDGFSKECMLPPISFNYLGQFDGNKKGNWQVTSEKSGMGMPLSDKSTNIIDINSWVVNGEMSFNMVSFLKEEDANKFVSNFQSYLEKLILHCCKNVRQRKVSHTASDFSDYIPHEIVNEDANNLPIVMMAGGGRMGAEAFIGGGLISKLEGLQVMLLNYLPKKCIENLDDQDIALEYIRIIQMKYPEGPYCLVCECGGGNIMIEVARILVNRGEKISKLFFIDVYGGMGKFHDYLSSIGLKKLIPSNLSTNVPEKFAVNAEEIILFKSTKSDDYWERWNVAERYKFRNISIRGSFRKYKSKIFKKLINRIFWKKGVNDRIIYRNKKEYYYVNHTTDNHLSDIFKDKITVINVDSYHGDMLKNQGLKNYIANHIFNINLLKNNY